MNHMVLTERHLSPVLSKCPVILLHGLDLGVLVSVFFLFHCGLHTLFAPGFHPYMVTCSKRSY